MKNVLIGILVILVLIFGYLAFKSKDIIPPQQDNTLAVQQITSQTKEESPSESFKNQPGSIQNIKKDDSSWILAVDLLTRNLKWSPGGEADFFMNQNPKVRNLMVNNDTKTYNCETFYADGKYEPAHAQDNAVYISNIENILSRSKTDTYLVGDYGYTAYFDITGSTITAIYEQCLP